MPGIEVTYRVGTWKAYGCGVRYVRSCSGLAGPLSVISREVARNQARAIGRSVVPRAGVVNDPGWGRSPRRIAGRSKAETGGRVLRGAASRSGKR